MLLKRVLVAMILIPCVIWLTLRSSTFVFQLVTAVICLLAAWEWSSLINVTGYFKRTVYLVIIFTILSAVQFIPYIYILWIGVGWWCIAIFFIWRYIMYSSHLKNKFINGVIGILCIVPCWVGLNNLRVGIDGGSLVLLFLFLLWSMDTGAYIAGNLFGKHKLLPKVSPNKTVEGLLGGLFLMLLVLAVGIWILHLPQTTWLVLIITSIVMGLFSVLGDLFESMYKRMANVKDSGSMIPGHGGILDRLDSLFAAAPLFALSLIIFGLI
jgi:phosphatidate cytidylyltransferase